MQHILAITFLALYLLAMLGIALVVATENRNPLKTLPWIVLLVFVPILGLVIYFFFGQDLSKRRMISRRTRRRITTQLEEMNDPARPRISDDYRHVAHMLRQSASSVPLYGSRIEIYTNGEAKMEALLTDISRAKHHIHIQYYILMDDTVGCRLRDALVAKAKEGVQVRLLYDDVGSRHVKRGFFEGMSAAGIEVYPFLHVKFPHFTSRANYRNHRKIVVIDGRVGFMGGMNIADRYIDGGCWACWRDTDFRIEGSGAAGLQVSFLSDWSATTRQHLSDPTFFPPVECFSDDIMQIVASGPFGKWRTLLQAESYAIARARERVWVQTPYYMPSDLFNSTLQAAALAGVDVRLMLPRRSDSRIVTLATRSYLDAMMLAGVKIYFYDEGFLHAKLLIVDDMLSVIGSANMDFRSFEHNFEISAFVYDAEFTARMRATFEEDLTHCHALTRAEWFRRPRRQRVYESLMRIFSPLL